MSNEIMDNEQLVMSNKQEKIKYGKEKYYS